MVRLVAIGMVAVRAAVVAAAANPVVADMRTAEFAVSFLVPGKNA